MNDLEARRRLLADPLHLPPALQADIEGSPALAEFHHELLRMDADLRRALTQTPVPSGLADRIVLHARYGRRSGWKFALAAGLLALAIAVPWYRAQVDSPLEVAMMEHVRDNVDELRDDRGVEPAVLRTSVATLGVGLRDAGYRIRHLGHCVVAGRQGRHFTIDGPGGVVSFVVLPADGGADDASSLQSGDMLGYFVHRGGVLIGAFGGATLHRAELEKLVQRVFA